MLIPPNLKLDPFSPPTSNLSGPAHFGSSEDLYERQDTTIPQHHSMQVPSTEADRNEDIALRSIAGHCVVETPQDDAKI